jgi:hypothetical protein
MLGFAIRAAAAAASYVVTGASGAVLLIASQNPGAEVAVGAWVMLSLLLVGVISAVGFSLSLTQWVRRRAGVD